MNKIIAIIQARYSATRLPGKVLFKLEGKSVLEHVFERVEKSKLINEAIVATTILEKDLKIVQLCAAKGIRIYCGSETDVLDRYYQAARLLGAENVVRITADCPLIDPEIIDKAIRLHLLKRSDYTSNTLIETFPDGEDVEVFTFSALRRSWRNARLLSEREHVTPYIKKHPNKFKLVNLKNQENLSSKRWTLDEKADYKFIKLIYNKLYRKNSVFGIKEIIEFLECYPEYEQINQGIMRNEGYLKSLKKDKAVCENHKNFILRRRK